MVGHVGSDAKREKGGGSYFTAAKTCSSTIEGKGPTSIREKSGSINLAQY